MIDELGILIIGKKALSYGYRLQAQRSQQTAVWRGGGLIFNCFANEVVRNNLKSSTF